MVRIRTPILFSAIVGLLTLALAAPAAIAQLPGGTLPPGDIPKYVTPLVIPPVINDRNTRNPNVNRYDIAVRQFQQQILPGGIWNLINGRDDEFPATTIWSYGPAADPPPDITELGGPFADLDPGVAPAANSQFNYPAYTFETMTNVPVEVRWINELTEEWYGQGDALEHLLPIDRTLHWANPERDCREGEPRTDCSGDNPTPYLGPVPIVTHVHGAHVDPHSDGYPEAWWLPRSNGDWTPCESLEDENDNCYVTEGTIFDSATGQIRFDNDGFADYVYRQDQPATTLWYHDHSLGMTRSNVYAGPAGFWLIRGGMYDGARDSNTGMPAVLPGPAPEAGQTVLELNLPTAETRMKIREIPIVIQGRSFNEDGSLFYPDNRAFFEGLDPEDLDIEFVPDSDIAPIWNPEAFFNVMVVNGVSWPNLDVAPTKYRFRFLNGCNSRFLILRLVFVPLAGDVDDPEDWVQVPGAFWQIGAEQGFLPEPEQLDELLMGLAERADVIMDFEAIDNYIRTNHQDVFAYNLYLVNVGPDEPFGGGTPTFGCDPEGAGPADCFEPSDPETTGQVMRFTLNNDLLGWSNTDPVKKNGKDNPHDATDPDDLLLNAEDPLGVADNAGNPRTLSLNEGSSEEVCVIIGEDSIEQILGVEPGEDFEEDCEEAGGEPFGPKEALLGIVEYRPENDEPAGLYPVPLKWTDTSKGAAVNVNLTNGTVVPVWVTENPTVGDIEEWDIYNVTADAHPIHLHLVRFEVVNRRELTLDEDDEVEIPITEVAMSERGPEVWETGFKDTVISYPGEVTRVKAKFDIEGLYVWHCHIVEHEDNEMMRPYVVSAAD
jgi:spore coat protein A